MPAPRLLRVLSGRGTGGEIGLLLCSELEEPGRDVADPLHLREGSAAGAIGLEDAAVAAVGPAVGGGGGSGVGTRAGGRMGRGGDLDVVDEGAVGIGGGGEGVGAAELVVDDEAEGVIAGGQPEGSEEGGL